MHSNKLLLITAAFVTVLISAANFYALSARPLNLPDSPENMLSQDGDEAVVGARVARFSYVTGEAQIRRMDASDWERVTLNLPIVEGDEITTSPGSRIEIQFDSYTYLRLPEESYLRVVTLRAEGIALSLPRGIASFRLTEFNKNQAYFEVDAPGSTIAVQKAGMFRIDVGSSGVPEVRVSVTESGEARIYSESSGFLLKSGRTARVFVQGPDAGEWEIGQSQAYPDAFDNWAVARDVVIAKSLQDASYDKYYDRDIYGAEDLNNSGEWIYTQKYGYVWRPFPSATSGYANWSPYRYGQWRWMPPYGWTWVNDEPWGWATYHHGRWFYDAGYWNWSPYGADRYAQSVWSPAMVVVTVYGGNICWYPLPYTYAYYNFNYYYNAHSGWGHHGGGQGGNGGGGGGGIGPTPSPTPVTPVVAGGPLSRPKGPIRPPLEIVPPNGVVSIPATDFGRLAKGNLMPPLNVANGVLARVPTVTPTGPVLPVYADVRDRGARDVNVSRPRITNSENNARTGAAVRRPDAPLDQELRSTRMLGGRPPLMTNRDPAFTAIPGANIIRPTGAVERRPAVAPDPAVDRSPDRRPPSETQRAPIDRQPRYDPPVQIVPRDTERPRPTPRYEPPARQEPPASRPTAPRNDPPVNRPPAVRPEPPAAKPEPKPDSKPPLEENTGRKKDGI